MPGVLISDLNELVETAALFIQSEAINSSKQMSTSLKINRIYTHKRKKKMLRMTRGGFI